MMETTFAESKQISRRAVGQTLVYSSRVAPMRLAAAALWAIFVSALALLAARDLSNGPGGDDSAVLRPMESRVNSGSGLDARSRATAIGHLRGEPLSSRFLTIIALDEGIKGHEARSRALLHLANRFTRRDLPVQLAMIEEAVQREQVADALDHYEIALSISTRADPVLLPVLASALAHPDIRMELSKRISARTAWRARFLNVAIAGPPRYVAPLLERWADEPGQLSQFQARLLERFLSIKDYSGAFDFAQRIAGGEWHGDGASAFAQVEADDRFRPLSWQMPDLDGIRTFVENGRFQITAQPDAGGVVLFRIFRLKPGPYVLSQTWSAQGEGSRGSWEWQCLGSTETPLAQFTVDLPPNRSTRLREIIDVPERCQAVRASLRVTTGLATGESELTIDKSALLPARDMN